LGPPRPPARISQISAQEPRVGQERRHRSFRPAPGGSARPANIDGVVASPAWVALSVAGLRFVRGRVHSCGVFSQPRGAFERRLCIPANLPGFGLVKRFIVKRAAYGHVHSTIQTAFRDGFESRRCRNRKTSTAQQPTAQVRTSGRGHLQCAFPQNLPPAGSNPLARVRLYRTILGR